MRCKRMLGVLLSIITLLTMAVSFTAYALERAQKIVRVGWYDPAYDTTFYDGWRWYNNVLNRTRVGTRTSARWDYWETRALYLDGSVQLDGSSLLDGRTRIYAEGATNLLNRAETKMTVRAEMSFTDIMDAGVR